MGQTRILIVHDAVVVRRLLARILQENASLEVVGTAANGRVALAKITQQRPDLILLDEDVPAMDGIETLTALRESHPQIPIMMMSRDPTKGSSATRHALSLGARDCLAITDTADDREASLRDLRERLLAKIALHGVLAGGKTSHSGLGRKSTAILPPPRVPRTIDVVAIGASTGGPTALADVLRAIPANFPVPVVMVQHMPAEFTPRLARSLSAQCAIEVVEAAPGDVLTPGKAWLAPGNYHLALVREGNSIQLQTHQEAPENSCRPSVDVLLRSVVDIFGGNVLAVVLTGMGQDGLRGCERVREQSGQILVQDEPTSVVWGMPGFVARAGLADQVLPLDQIGAEVVRRVQQKRSFFVPSLPRA